MQTELNTQSGMTTKTLVPFLALTFGLTWGIAALLILFTDEIVAIFGEISMSNPLYILAVSSREALALALTRMGKAGQITSARAVELARMVLRENAIRLYGFEAL